MKLPVPVQYRGVFSVALLALSLVPAGMHFAEAGQRASQRQSEVEAIATNSQQDTAIGVERAKSCIVIDPATPLADNPAPVVYNGTKKKLPRGTNLCDLHGFTGVQTDSGVVDVRPIAAATLKKALLDFQNIDYTDKPNDKPKNRK